MIETAAVLSFRRGVEILRGHETASAHRIRIAIRRQEAFHRAIDGRFATADRAMFGDPEQLLRDGPGTDARLHAGTPPAAA